MAKLPNLMLAFLVILAGIQAETSASAYNRTERETKCPSCQSGSCHPKFRLKEGHTACLEKSSKATPIPMTDAQRQEIVNYHNKLRSEVDPPPTNMLQLSWDMELEMLARKWADACKRNETTNLFYHDKVKQIPGRFFVGQNLGNGHANFKQVTDHWYSERVNYTYDQPYYQQSNAMKPAELGHYTQMVWAHTNLIGCASTTCDGVPFYVCNYGPPGNIEDFTRPFESGGAKGSGCMTPTSIGLCDCGTVGCGNFGKMWANNCTCKCFYDQYKGTCQLDCNTKDPFFCGTADDFKIVDCPREHMFAACPNLCGICPCAEASYKPTMCPGSDDGGGGGGGGGGGDDTGSRIPLWTVSMFFGHLPDELNCLILLSIVRWFTENY